MNVRQLIYERGYSMLHRTYLLVFCSVAALTVILSTIYGEST